MTRWYILRYDPSRDSLEILRDNQSFERSLVWAAEYQEVDERVRPHLHRAVTVVEVLP